MNKDLLVADFYDQETCYRIDGERGVVAPVRCPPDRSQILGFGSFVETDRGKLFAAYFASDRAADDKAPDYKSGFSIFLEGGGITALHQGSARVEIKTGLFHRRFRMFVDGKERADVHYRWPLYREFWMRLLGDPFNFTSRDFFFEIVERARVYGRSGH